MSPAQLQASRALWRTREIYRYRRWQMYVRTRKPTDPLRAKWHALWDQALHARRARDAQLAKRNDTPHLDRASIDVLIEREGILPYVYNDSQGHATFGVGHLLHLGNFTAADAQKWGTKSNPKYTRAEAVTYFAKTDLPPYEKTVLDVFKGAKLAATPPRVGACVSLAFNVGQNGFASSTVAKEIKAGHLNGAADAFLLWNRPREIISRRRGERVQFLAGGGPYKARV